MATGATAAILSDLVRVRKRATSNARSTINLWLSTTTLYNMVRVCQRSSLLTEVLTICMSRCHHSIPISLSPLSQADINAIAKQVGRELLRYNML